MTGSTLLLLGSTLYVAAVGLRVFCGRWDGGREKDQKKYLQYAKCQTTGTQMLQADSAQVWDGSAGLLAVLADGIGRSNTGMVCAQIAADTVLDLFEPYQELNRPAYFFKASFNESHKRIQRTIGERRGGAGMAAVFTDGGFLHYAVAGDVRVALMRGDELIPLSKGQTLDVLAGQAFQEGKISRQDAVWSMDEKRVWNYLGQDGFHGTEVCDQPVRMKRGDRILLMSRGIFDVLSWREIEDILVEHAPIQELADRIVLEADRREGMDKENGSVILIQGMEA